MYVDGNDYYLHANRTNGRARRGYRVSRKVAGQRENNVILEEARFVSHSSSDLKTKYHYYYNDNIINDDDNYHFNRDLLLVCFHSHFLRVIAYKYIIAQRYTI